MKIQKWTEERESKKEPWLLIYVPVVSEGNNIDSYSRLFRLLTSDFGTENVFMMSIFFYNGGIGASNSTESTSTSTSGSTSTSSPWRRRLIMLCSLSTLKHNAVSMSVICCVNVLEKR